MDKFVDMTRGAIGNATRGWFGFVDVVRCFFASWKMDRARLNAQSWSFITKMNHAPTDCRLGFFFSP